ncbi:MAG: hypothetical protein CMK59_05935 [Proteobacteria bacterium]|nr:hypothetical protein [Pseudomonadota bacterium]
MSSSEDKEDRESVEQEQHSDKSEEQQIPSPNIDTELFSLIKEGMRGLLTLGREHLSEAAIDGRKVLELRSLKKDKTKMYEKLGREVERLIEAKEIDHPGLVRGIEKIQEINEQIERLKSED